MRRSPPRCRIGRCDELGRHFACRTERGIVENRDIFLDSSADRIGRQASSAFDAGPIAGVGLDQTGIDSKALAADQPLIEASLQDGLEQAPQQIAVAKAAVPVLRKGRMIGYITVEPEPAKPAIGEVQMDLFAQPPLR